MSKYVHLLKEWPAFKWEDEKILLPLSAMRHKQGRLLGKLEGLGFRLREEATLETLTQDVVKSSEIEGERLPADEVRSSIARRLGIEIAGEVAVSRNVEGIVEMMLDATQKYKAALTDDRLFGWHATLFPTGRSGMHKIKVGAWRDDANGPMQVVSGAMGKERVHYEAPEATRLDVEMKTFLQWFNQSTPLDPVLKAAIAHLWFVTLHPFDDGNGRIARAIADMQLARADGSRQRFYSMSAQIQRERNVYYDVLEKTQKGNLDITAWLLWFFDCLDRAIALSEENLSGVMHKAKFWESNQTVALNERQRKMLNAFMDGFEGKLTSSKWAKMAKCSPDTALRDMQDLIEKGILEKEEGGGRSTSYKLRS
ncbi:Fic family protein [Chryseolinea soli]|uniref:Fic family protein n=1 Tax=Chryseolinea soli TaxID=2321403 RepID=A0A385SIE0_9BACT|nr:Fic family protein [Chryseolinea soli]AYB31503.1 Fic family protein [Chryseolinea soli]